MTSPVVLGAYALGIALFAVVFAATRLSDTFGQVTAAAKTALGVIRDPALDDDIKEETARRVSGDLLRQALAVLVKGTMSVAAALFPLWAAEALGLASLEESLGFASRWDVLVITTLLVLAIWYLWRHLKSQ